MENIESYQYNNLARLKNDNSYLSKKDTILCFYNKNKPLIKNKNIEYFKSDLENLNFSDFTATLRLQKYMDPREPDFHSLVMHKLTVGWTSGYLSLESSYG